MHRGEAHRQDRGTRWASRRETRRSTHPTVGGQRMEIRRIAVIYDDRERPETTGVYGRRALESLVEVVHFRPDELAALPDRGFDLYLNIDDGLEYHLPAELHPCAWWAIDTHLNVDWCRHK